jgi:DNA-binding IclR family transcriptional regulator
MPEGRRVASTSSPRLSRKTPTVESVVFLDRILNCFSADAPALGVTRIARLLHVPKARVHRFLISMEQVGFVRRVPDADLYALGMHLYGLGMLAVNGASDLERVNMRAQELSERYGYTAVVGIWSDNEYLAVQTFMPARSLGLAAHNGFHSAAYATAQGRIFLAFLPDHELEAYFRETEFRALTPETLTDVAGIRAELATIREQLFAVASNQTVLGATAIAAPVFNAQGKVLATIALVWFTPELAPRAKELGPQVRDLGLDLSAELGFRVPPPCHTSACAGEETAAH